DPDVNVIERLDDYIQEDPKQALMILDKILEKVENKKIIGSVGAGPLEDLLGSKHGKEYAPIIIGRAGRDKKWKLAFGCVWTAGFRDRETATQIERSLEAFFPDGRP